jgi:hypothetical protein
MNESVSVKTILFDGEAAVMPFQIARPVVGNSMTKDQILRPRRRSDRIGLNETQIFDRVF